MDDGAHNEDSGGGLRARRREATYAALTAEARRLTAERTLSGFTVEEVADAVGVSRRTVFNYFQTKEDAVLGVRDDDLLAEHREAFLESAGRQDLPEALRDLMVTMLDTIEHVPTDGEALIELMHGEPALLRRMDRLHADRHRQLAALIAEREGLDAEDAFAATAAGLVGHLVMSTMRELAEDPHRPGDDGPADSAESDDAAGAQDGTAEAPPRARLRQLLAERFEHARRLFG
ncbi:TetR/AcrR family transcriptional regulator [Nesterenkonia sp. F]|uniref:TetR/AcrR family transcriptional regulator n=1 Tax=Nesterenkonia sp. F TaxID=795955 RepID=UPI000255D16F|nr:TetR/AcrR family transcriptional regulator [Nesterenkonia sp. F]